MNDVRPAVVVGGGASGALVSIQLLAAGWPVVLVDPGATPGRGFTVLLADGVVIPTAQGCWRWATTTAANARPMCTYAGCG